MSATATSPRTPKRSSAAAQSSGVFDRLSGGSTRSTRTAGGQSATSSTAASRSTTGAGAPLSRNPSSPRSSAARAERTPSSASAGTPKKAAASPRAASKPAASPTRSSTRTGSASPTKSRAKQPAQVRRKSETPAPASTTAAEPEPKPADKAKSPTPPPEEPAAASAANDPPSDSSAAEPEKQPSLVASPSSVAAPPPAEELTEEQEEEVKQLELVRDEKKEELARIEQHLHCFALRFKAANATERAEHFNQRTAETLAENKHMRREIEMLRNSDRVMVSLRDTLETQKKHYRIRTAHIRQKEATIAIIAKRCMEQRGEREHMLEQLDSDCVALDELAQDEASLEELVESVAPQRCMGYLLRSDGLDEEHIDATIRDIEALRAEDRTITRELHSQLSSFSESIDVASNVKAASSGKIAEEWADTKARMLAEYQRLCGLTSELEFHVRRGTNIKSTSNLPETLSPEEKTVRDLTLTLGEEEARLRQARVQHDAVDRRITDGPSGYDSAESAKQTEASAVNRLLSQLQEANSEWRARYRELQRTFTGAALNDADWEEDAGEADAAAASPAATPQRQPRPRAFTPASAERLFSAKTKSRAVADEISQIEAEDREIRAMRMRRRPVPARGA